MYKSFPRILRTRIDWQVIKSHHQRSPERHLSACALHLLQQNPSISRFQDNIATKSEHFSFSNGKPVGLIDQVAVALRRIGGDFTKFEIAGPLLAFGRMLMFKIGGVSFKREIGINGYLTNLSGVIGSKDKFKLLYVLPKGSWFPCNASNGRL
ncbi:hypothetical protein P8452_71340 [Trifolium repens]|nr:hypothetical protein P8452_71340 [Trifolium repens]